MTKQIDSVKQIVGRGLMAYTQDVIAAVAEGYELDLSMGKHPEFLYNGLFIANMCKYVADSTTVKILPGGGEVGQGSNVEDVDKGMPESPAVFTADSIKQKGRPSAASKAKEALAERLGNDVVASQRGKS